MGPARQGYRLSVYLAFTIPLNDHIFLREDLQIHGQENAKNLMKTPQGITPYIIQMIVLGVGIALIATSRYWSDHTLALVSGIFFINIFWVTMVLGNDFRIWSFLRNSAAGNIFMFGVIVANLGFIAVKAFMRLF